MLTNYDKQIKKKEVWEKIKKLTQEVDYGIVEIFFRDGIPIRLDIRKQIQLNNTDELDSVSLG